MTAEPVRTDSPARPWRLSLASAVAVGLPLILGSVSDQLALGALGALGALVILHIPVSASSVPLSRLLACAAGVAISPLLGQLTTAWPQASLPLFGVLIAAIVAMTRASSLPAPGHTFFVLGACAGAAEGFHPSLMPFMLMVPALAAAAALAIGMGVLMLWGVPGARHPMGAGLLSVRPSVRAIGIEAFAFGAFAMAALAIAQWLGLDRPYWVPISCVAVMRGMSLQAVWNRNLERIIGTLVGVGITLLILVAHPHPETVVVIVMILVLSIHRTLGQNYAVTVLLATPASLLITELASLDRSIDVELLITRVQDIALGSLIGVMGGTVLHASPLRAGGRG